MRANDSVFPWYNPGNNVDSYSETGITLRAYIAVEAMKALISGSMTQDLTNATSKVRAAVYNAVIDDAILIADAMAKKL